MQNTLPDTLKKRIEDEAEAATREREKTMKEAKRIPFSSEYCDGWADGYEEAAIKIISNPGEWGLAGVWVKCADNPLPDSSWTGPVRFGYKDGYWRYSTRTGVAISNDLRAYPDMEWLDESPTPSSRVQQLEQALREIADIDNPNSFWQMKEIATNALKTDKQ